MTRRLLLFACCVALFAPAAELSEEGVLERLTAAGGSVTRDAGRVIRVDLSSSWVTDADLALVAALPGIEAIDLSQTKISDMGLEHLKGLSSVRELNLHFAEYVTDSGIAHITGWKNLERLTLRGTKVTSRVFGYLALLPSLRRLDISGTEVTDSGFEELAELTELETLAIGGNRILGPALDLLRLVPSLRHLDVSGIQRVDSGLWGIALNDANMEKLARLTKLESLNLAGANLSDRGLDRPGHELARRKELHSLPEIGSLVELREINLDRTFADHEDLAVLTKLPKLRSLSLAYAPQVDDKAAAVLRELGAIESLRLTATQVGDATLEALAQSRALRQLYVGGTNATAEGVARFRAARPDCAVVWWASSGDAFTEN
jgi:hypothetical protein